MKAAIDLGFVREEVFHWYGKNGNESVAGDHSQANVLLFFDDIASERELMEVVRERLNYP